MALIILQATNEPKMRIIILLPNLTSLRKEADPNGTGDQRRSIFCYWRKAFTIAVAEKLSIPVCYPFQDFVDASADTHNKAKSVALNKPYLNNSSDDSDETTAYLKLGATAYFQLGKQVGRFIGGMADVGVATWDGSSGNSRCCPRSR